MSEHGGSGVLSRDNLQSVQVFFYPASLLARSRHYQRSPTFATHPPLQHASVLARGKQGTKPN